MEINEMKSDYNDLLFVFFSLVNILLQVFMDFKQGLVANLSLEWSLLKRPLVFLTILFTMFMQWMHSTAHNLVYFLADKYGVYGGDENTLTDLGFIGLEKILPYGMEHLSNSMLALVVTLAVKGCASVVWTNYIIQNKEVRFLQILLGSSCVC